MSEPALRREFPLSDAGPPNSADDLAGADPSAIPITDYLPPSPRRLQIASLQHWLDLCA
jgi:hypothetical protein